MDKYRSSRVALPSADRDNLGLKKKTHKEKHITGRRVWAKHRSGLCS